MRMNTGSLGPRSKMRRSWRQLSGARPDLYIPESLAETMEESNPEFLAETLAESLA